MRVALVLFLIIHLCACSTPSSTRATDSGPIDQLYRADCSSAFTEAQWPASHHPSLGVMHCGLTQFTYTTPDGVDVGVETVLPSTILEFWIAPSTNLFGAGIRGQIGMDGTNAVLHVQHGTNTWTLDAGEIKKSNKPDSGDGK